MNKNIVGILDYKVGNLYSIYKSINKLGYNCKFITNRNDFKFIDTLILPGVGAFGSAMKNLNSNLKIEILNHIEKKKTLIAICLGMQILFEESEEDTSIRGLSLFNGKVKKFNSNLNIKIPNVGWKSIKFNKKSLFNFEYLNGDYYFNHSYYISSSKNMYDDIITSKYFDNEFISYFNFKNIFAFQFHPEHSKSSGLKLLDKAISFSFND